MRELLIALFIAFGSSFAFGAVSTAYLGTDSTFKGTTIQGSWVGKGIAVDGYHLLNWNEVETNYVYPPYIGGVQEGSFSKYRWAASTFDTRAVQNAAGTQRQATCWFSTNQEYIRIPLTADATFVLGVYMLDFNSSGRKASIAVCDSTVEALMSGDEAPVEQNSDNYVPGWWTFWRVSGSSGDIVSIRLRPRNSDAAVCMVSFDPWAPSITSFTAADVSSGCTLYTNERTVKIDLAALAMPDTAVNYYQVTAEDVAPDAWLTEPPATFTIPDSFAEGPVTLYGWAMDNAGAIGKAAFTIEYTTAINEAPTLGSVVIDPVYTFARISWTSSEPGYGRLLYGSEPGLDYMDATAWSPSGTDHAFVLRLLTPGTTYYYAVQTGNTISAEDSFTTPAAGSIVGGTLYPNLLAGSTATFGMTGANGTPSCTTASLYDRSIDYVRLQATAPPNTATGWVEYRTAEPFTAGTVLAFQDVWYGFTAGTAMPYDLKLGGTTVGSSAGLPGSIYSTIAKLGTPIVTDTLRIDYPRMASQGSNALADMLEVTIISDVLDVPTCTVDGPVQGFEWGDIPAVVDKKFSGNVGVKVQPGAPERSFIVSLGAVRNVIGLQLSAFSNAKAGVELLAEDEPGVWHKFAMADMNENAIRAFSLDAVVSTSRIKVDFGPGGLDAASEGLTEILVFAVQDTFVSQFAACDASTSSTTFTNDPTVNITLAGGPAGITITDYAVTESPEIPTSWSPSPPSTYTIQTTGEVTLYGWVRDSAGNTAFATQAIYFEPAVPEVYDTTTAATGATSATVTWTTDVEAYGKIEYKAQASETWIATDFGPRALAHAAQLDNLMPGVTYDIRIHSNERVDTIAYGHIMETSTVLTGPDAVAVYKEVTITWTSDVEAYGIVGYGVNPPDENGNYEQLVGPGPLTTEHIMRIGRLAYGTTYHFAVRTGGSPWTTDATFTTLGQLEQTGGTVYTNPMTGVVPTFELTGGVGNPFLENLGGMVNMRTDHSRIKTDGVGVAATITFQAAAPIRVGTMLPMQEVYADYTAGHVNMPYSINLGDTEVFSGPGLSGTSPIDIVTFGAPVETDTMRINFSDMPIFGGLSECDLVEIVLLPDRYARVPVTVEESVAGWTWPAAQATGMVDMACTHSSQWCIGMMDDTRYAVLNLGEPQRFHAILASAVWANPAVKASVEFLALDSDGITWTRFATVDMNAGGIVIMKLDQPVTTTKVKVDFGMGDYFNDEGLTELILLQALDQQPAITAFTLADQSTGSTLFTDAATVDVSIAVDPNAPAADAFMFTTTADKPAADATGWDAAPATLTLAAVGSVTLYAWAKSADGTISEGAPATICFSTAAPAISNLTVTTVTPGTTVTIAWTTSIPAESALCYGPVKLSGITASVAPEGAAAVATDHSITVSGLTSGTNYRFVLVNNEKLSSDILPAPGIIVFWPSIWPIPCDVNRDCKVNILDLISIRNKLNQPVATADNIYADVNLPAPDGKINILDLIAVRNKLNTQCPQ